MDNLLCSSHNNGESAETSPFLCGPPPNRKRRARTQFDYYAVQRLEAVFRLNQYPDIVMRESLSDEIGVSEARVQTWFQNKRSRTKRTLRRTDDPPSPGCSETSPTGTSTEASSVPTTPVIRKRSKAPSPRRRAPVVRDNLAAATKTSPPVVSGFRPFYREFLSPETTTNVPSKTAGLSVNTGYPVLPSPWMYALLSQQQHLHAMSMPSYLPPLFPVPPSWSASVVPPSDQFLLSTLPGVHVARGSPCGNSSPDSTVQSRRDGPKATSTPIVARLKAPAFASETEKPVDEAPSSDSDAESVDKVVQDSGYTSGKSDSEDQIDVCS